MSKWTDTAFTQGLAVSYPIIQGPFGRGSSSTRLAAAVSNADHLGPFGVNDLAPVDIFNTLPAAELHGSLALESLEK